jgi:GH43 family beta-xylosidase
MSVFGRELAELEGEWNWFFDTDVKKKKKKTGLKKKRARKMSASRDDAMMGSNIERIIIWIVYESIGLYCNDDSRLVQSGTNSA